MSQHKIVLEAVGIPANRRVAFLAPVMKDIAKRGYLPTTEAVLHQVLCLMQNATHIPLNLHFTLYLGSVYSFVFAEELHTLTNQVYFCSKMQKETVFRTGSEKILKEIEREYSGELRDYDSALYRFCEFLSLLSPQSLDLVSLAAYLNMQPFDVPLGIRMRRQRNSTNQEMLDAAIDMLRFFQLK